MNVLQKFKNTKFFKFFFSGLTTIFAILFFGKNFLNLSILNSVLLGVAIYIVLIALWYGVLYISRLINKFISGKINEELKNHPKHVEDTSNEQKLKIDTETNIIKKQYLSYMNKLSIQYSNAFLQFSKSQWNNELGVKYLSNVCNDVKKILAEKSNNLNNFNVSIHFFSDAETNSETPVSILCTDYKSSYRYPDKNKIIKISESSGFQFVYNHYKKAQKEKIHYTNNNIKNDTHYQDSDISNFEEDVVSVLVLGIINPAADDLIGFLKIDSEKPDSFIVEEEEISILQPFSYLVYNVLKELQNSKGEKRNETQETN